MYFPSKKDLFFRIIIFGTVLACFIPSLISFDWIVFLIMAPIGIVLLWFWFTTGYLIEEDQMIVKFGPFKQKININSIRKLSKSKSLLSSPALSIDRIEILYNNYDIVYISPEYRKDFIHFLLEINPNIEIDERLIEEK